MLTLASALLWLAALFERDPPTLDAVPSRRVNSTGVTTPSMSPSQCHGNGVDRYIKLNRASQTMVRFPPTSPLRCTVLPIIHVGKAGGGTVREVVRNALRRADSVSPRCPIAERVVELHLQPAPLHLMRNTLCAFLSRDPVSRVVSAFNWRQPSGGGAPARPGSAPGIELELYRCFNHPEPFARAFGKQGAGSKCGKIARQVAVHVHARTRTAARARTAARTRTPRAHATHTHTTRAATACTSSLFREPCMQEQRSGAPPQVMDQHVKHIGQGLEFYYGGVLSELSQLSYILMETEALDAGLRCLRTRWFPSLPVPERGELLQLSIHESYASKHQNITSEARLMLRAALQREYHVLAQLRAFAQPCAA